MGFLVSEVPSVLLHCWLGVGKGIRSIKNEGWDAGVVICLEQGADLRMAQGLASVKYRLVLPSLYRLICVVPDKGQLNGCVLLVSEMLVDLNSSHRIIFALLYNQIFVPFSYKIHRQFDGHEDIGQQRLADCGIAATAGI